MTRHVDTGVKRGSKPLEHVYLDNISPSPFLKTFGDDSLRATSGKNITMLCAYIKNVGAETEETKIKR